MGRNQIHKRYVPQNSGDKAAKYNDLSFRTGHRYGPLTYWVCLINRLSGVHILKHLSFRLNSTLIWLLTLQYLECMPSTFFLKGQILHWLTENKLKHLQTSLLVVWTGQGLWQSSELGLHVGRNFWNNYLMHNCLPFRWFQVFFFSCLKLQKKPCYILY